MLRRTLMLAALVMVFVTITAGQAMAQTGRFARDRVYDIEQLKPGIFLVPGGGGNTTVRVTDQGVIVVDTKNPGQKFFDDLMTQIRKVTNQPVRYAFAHHHHFDHAGNTGRFNQAGAQTIMQTKEFGYQVQRNPNFEAAGVPEEKPVAPTVTYEREHIVRLGNVEERAYHFGGGHTGADTIVYFPDVRVVHIGDNYSGPGALPGMDAAYGGGLVGLQAIYKGLLKLDWDIAVPGHTEPAKRSDIEEISKKLDTLVARAVDLIRKGVAKDQLFTQLNTEDIGWNVTRLPASLYDELAALAMK
jgi:cyclase